MADNQSNRSNFSVSTNIVSMFDDQSVQLRIGGLDNAMSVAFWLPVQGDNGRNTYPQDHRISVVLTPERVAALDHVLQEQVLPALEEGRQISRSVFTSRSCTNMLQISMEDDGIYLYLHKDINEDRIAKDSYRFHFEDFMILTSYKPKTGDYDVDKCLATFYLFTQTIHAFVQDAGGVSAHGARVGTRYSTDRIFSYLTAIAQAVNAVIQTNNYGNGGGRGYTNPGFSENGPGNSPAPQMQELNNLSDILQ